MWGNLKPIRKRLKSAIAKKAMRPEMDRNEKILAQCNLDGIGLEIGAGYSPAVTKSQGYNIEVLDHA